MNPLQTLLSRLPGAKQAGKGWSARCPAHADQRASLSIAQGDDGTALLKCHAGCHTSTVLAAVGLELRDLFPPKDRLTPARNGKHAGNDQTFTTANDAIAELERRHGKRSALWIYYNGEGEPVGLIIRWDRPTGKIIRPVSRHADGWRIGGMAEPRPLYGLPALAAAGRVVVVEGEKVADAAWSLGFTGTTSAGGSQAAAKTDWRPLAGKDVVILPDHDPAGERYAEDVARLATAAGAASVRILRLAEHAPSLPDGGDLADALAAEDWCGMPLGDAAEPADLAALIEQLAQAVEPWRPKVAAEVWPDLVPFNVMALPSFPTRALPNVLREWVEAESHATQTPADLAALLVLAVCSACIARRVVVEPRPGWREPVNLFTAVLLEPGNRKSVVFADATKPLRELEAELIEAARPIVARAQSDRRQDEWRLRKLEKTAAEKHGDEAAQARHEAGILAANLADDAEPVLPRLLVDDATAEKLGMMLAEQGGRIASMSPEGGVFDLMAGLYSKSGIPQFGVYLMGHSGDDLITDRVSRKSVRVERPALTCAYAMQPAVIEGLAKNAAFRGRGLLARFLYAAPQSWIGRREIGTAPVSDATREAYRQAVRALAEVEGETVLQLTGDAAGLLRNWETEIEIMLGDGGQMEIMRDWGAKLAGATLRLAAVLHCVERGPAGRIEGRTIAAAVEIARYLVPHAEAVLNMMLANEESADDDARYVLRWIERHGRREFTKSEAQHHGKRRFPKADDIDPALAELTWRGYIRPKPTETSGPGRPPSPAYEVNPAVFEDAKPEMRSQYSQNSTGKPERGNSGNNGNVFEQSEITIDPFNRTNAELTALGE